MSTKKGGNVPLVEPHSLQDIFASGLAEIEILGTTNARFILFSEHTPAHGAPERVVVATIVMPVEAILDAVWMTIDRLAAHGIAISQRDERRILS